jgi:hypothetical protein
MPAHRVNMSAEFVAAQLLRAAFVSASRSSQARYNFPSLQLPESGNFSALQYL